MGWSYFPWSEFKLRRDQQPIRFSLFVYGGAIVGALMRGGGLLLLLGLIGPLG